MKLFTMDPGDNTALVFWGEGKVPFQESFFRLTPKQKQLSIAERHRLLVSQVQKEFSRVRYFSPGGSFKFVIEGVSLWGGSSKSQTAALRGDSFRLAYLVGGMITAFQGVFPDSEVEVVDVRSWKGSLPTEILISEVARYTGRLPENEHIACAIGIGMNYFKEL